MSTHIYNWKRFWCSRSGNINLSDGGYLFDPDSEYRHIYNPDVVPFESISVIPCLILLGEPGIGKTHAMKTAQNAIHNKVKEEREQILCLDLRSYGTDMLLIRNLFENTTFLSWIRGKHRLHLFLDSLDECLLRIDTLATLLVEEFKKYPVERLCLRIACRTADWPNSFENGLIHLWGKDAAGVYELAPLRRVDVIEAAKAHNLAPDVFLQEIDQKEIVPLAIKPVTLNFLINIYLKKGHLPLTQSELYLQGCRLLCEETNESRRDARLTGSFSIEQRLTISLRLAAITIFSNRYAIWTGVNRGDVPDEDITIQELCGGNEGIDGVQFQVTENAIKETLGTGLFSSRGPNRMGWAHQTYAEFLAAMYLIKHEMTNAQIMSLFVHPGDPENKLVPQLHETAAWLAGMLPELFRKFMRINPEVLLRSDVAKADAKELASLVESLLKLYDEEELIDRDWDNQKRYKKLAHPNLAEQLRPYISDHTKCIIVRRVAINIAEACKLQTLQNDLADIALNQKQPLSIRKEAIYALGHIADDNTKIRLKPLATGNIEEDTNNELKGYSLQALWPNYIKAEELFANLTSIKRQRFFGAYQYFLSYELARKLAPNVLPTALKWIECQESNHKSNHCFEKLEDSIILKAWEYIELPGVLPDFAKSVLILLKRHRRIVSNDIEQKFRNILSNENNDNNRRRVLEAILPLISNPEKDTIHLTPLVFSRDVMWMLERLRVEKSKEIHLIWADLINWAFDRKDAVQLDAIIVACQSNKTLAETFSWLLKPIELNSSEAAKMKADYLERLKWQKRNKERPLLEPSPAERVAELLNECESGNSSAWWQLNMEMTLEPDSNYYGDELEPDLTILPVWKTADTETRARIVAAAKRYVFEQVPETQKWLGENSIYRPAFAGYRALRLLLKELPDFISSLPPDLWKKWAPIILAYPILTDGDKETHLKLIKISYLHAPDEIIRTLMVLINKENKDLGRINIIREVEVCWDNRIANALLTKVKDENLKSESIGCLLRNLLDHGVVEAKTFAETLISSPSSACEIKRSKAIVAARELMNHAADAGWPVVWQTIQNEVEFGRKVIETLAHENDTSTERVWQLLTEDRLADLYIWIAHQYPHAEDPKHNEAYWVETRDSIAHFRDSILNHLKQRGTHNACDAIQRIVNEFPKLKWLKWILQEAQSITRRQTWVPPNPCDILKIANNQRARLVQSGEQLLDVLVESLKLLVAKLQGETPAVFDLWNEIKENKKTLYRPKDENRISDYIKRYLDDDLKKNGIIVNREVEIRRVEGSGQGERTDIHVDAVIRNNNNEIYDSITVIIEVKGCWHKELNHAMETQLVDRYLKDNQCQHGLYLVGWFNCNQWDANDRRKQRTAKISINELQKKLETQAAELSKKDIRVKAFVMNAAIR